MYITRSGELRTCAKLPRAHAKRGGASLWSSSSSHYHDSGGDDVALAEQAFPSRRCCNRCAVRGSASSKALALEGRRIFAGPKRRGTGTEKDISLRHCNFLMQA
mmetsp:Transcript_48542/g.103862  ORF Transcript_48542/g.103862 Transcript_48542/m.103862 type:complete len:104 (-) Transcript_48542:106-417(-)